MPKPYTHPLESQSTHFSCEAPTQTTHGTHHYFLQRRLECSDTSDVDLFRPCAVLLTMIPLLIGHTYRWLLLFLVLLLLFVPESGAPHHLLLLLLLEGLRLSGMGHQLWVRDHVIPRVGVASRRSTSIRLVREIGRFWANCLRSLSEVEYPGGSTRILVSAGSILIRGQGVDSEQQLLSCLNQIPCTVMSLDSKKHVATVNF